MKTLFALFCLSLATLTFAADAPDAAIAALTAADDARVQATTHADKAGLDAVFSDELRYAHSSGVVDTKASYMDSMLSGKLKYKTFEYEERNFKVLSLELALMTGRNKVKVVTATGEATMTLSFLAVWRNEGGHWRFLAWQSCKLPVPAPAKP